MIPSKGDSGLNNVASFKGYVKLNILPKRQKILHMHNFGIAAPAEAG
jgi:hypothetical protein